MRNLVTDVEGVLVGHAHDPRLGSGTTAIVFETPAVTSVDVRGGGPGTHDSDLLDPAMTVEQVDGITISGGSAFGLEAACGAQAWMREQGRGFAIGPARVPIVPGAVLFDLLAGGDKDWGRFSPFRDLGYAAAAAAGKNFQLGSVGAGMGATTVNLKGGIGSASAVTSDGHVVGALAAVNPTGSVIVGDGPWFWAAALEQESEFGGVGWPAKIPQTALTPTTKASALQSTTPALVATDAALSKAQVWRLAVMAQTGMARAIYPVHTPLDGDLVFAVATGRKPLRDPFIAMSELGAIAANTLARAIARAVYEATPLPFAGALPSWRDKFGPRSSGS
jgi:L-aminopeptidase/D-esterase-like protein